MELEFIAKFILNGLIAGSLYAVLALGLSLLYGVMRFVNLAHGEYALVPAFAFYYFYIHLAWPFVAAFIVSMLILAGVVLIIEKLTFLPVRDSKPHIALIISIAVGIILQNILVLLSEGQPLELSRTTAPGISLFGSEIIRITPVQIIILVASLGLLLGMWAFLKYSRLGKAIRAVSDNKEVAAILGIPINSIITYTFLISAFLAGCAGILIGFDQNLHATAGRFITVKSFAAVMLGGMGSLPGSVLGAYFIGLVENILIIPFGVFFIPSNYKDAIAYVALILILYIKPTGLLGASKEEAVRK